MRERQLSTVDWRGALAASDLPSMAKLVGGFGLANYMSSRGTNAFPSLETLAADCSVAKSTVAENLRLLVEAGWLTKTAGGGRGHRTAYEATIPAETVRQADGSSVMSRSRTASSAAPREPLRAVPTAPPDAGRSTTETVVHTDGFDGRKLSASPSETVRLTARNSPPGGTELDQEQVHEAAASATTAAELAAQLGSDAAAASLVEDLQAMQAGARLVAAAWRDPERARAWIAIARDEARLNPAGFVASGLASGEWPSPRGGSLVSASKKQAWVDETCWKLDREHARSIVDDWDDVDESERAMWHQAVDDAFHTHAAGLASRRTA